MTGTSDRRFTTADLDNIMDGTTPGPWTWHDSDDPDSRFIYGEEGHMCISVDSSGSDYRAADPHLMAAAPDLAAELHRIRTQIEERARIWAKVAEKLESLGHMSNAEVVQTHLAQITRILNGDTNE